MGRHRTAGKSFVNVAFRVPLQLAEQWKRLLEEFHTDGTEAIRRLMIESIVRRRIPGIELMLLPDHRNLDAKQQDGLPKLGSVGITKKPSRNLL